MIGETEIAAHILKLSKMMVKLESAVEDIQKDNRKLQNENLTKRQPAVDMSNRRIVQSFGKRDSTSERTGEHVRYIKRTTTEMRNCSAI